jgi:spermidine synthase
LILDAFRGGFVPPHLKTEEFYRECAARMTERGVFVTNLHQGTELFAADLKTIRAVFPQVVLYEVAGRGNVIACAVKYAAPDMGRTPDVAGLKRVYPALAEKVDLAGLAAERVAFPEAAIKNARVLTDDFSPVEFLDALKSNNTIER